MNVNGTVGTSCMSIGYERAGLKTTQCVGTNLIILSINLLIINLSSSKHLTLENLFDEMYMFMVSLLQGQ